jgi:hypothetical protein
MPVKIDMTLTLKGFISSRRVSAKISVAFFEAAYVAGVERQRLERSFYS